MGVDVTVFVPETADDEASVDVTVNASTERLSVAAAQALRDRLDRALAAASEGAKSRG